MKWREIVWHLLYPLTAAEHIFYWCSLQQYHLNKPHTDLKSRNNLAIFCFAYVFISIYLGEGAFWAFWAFLIFGVSPPYIIITALPQSLRHCTLMCNILHSFLAGCPVLDLYSGLVLRGFFGSSSQKFYNQEYEWLQRSRCHTKVKLESTCCTSVSQLLFVYVLSFFKQ